MCRRFLVILLIMAGVSGSGTAAAFGPNTQPDPNPNTCYFSIRGRVFEYPCPPTDCSWWDPETGEWSWIPCPF